MSSTSVERMKKLIEDKKKKATQQGSNGSTSNKLNSGPTKGFKSNKRAGSLNKQKLSIKISLKFDLGEFFIMLINAVSG